MSKLPHLNALETVEVTQASRLILAGISLLLTAGFLSSAIWAYTQWCRNAPDLKCPIMTGIIIGGGVCLWSLYKLLCSEYHWRTNADGLFVRSLLRSRFTRWQEMCVAPRVTDKTRSLSSLTILAASIWQHMYAHSKVSDLPDFALTFWDGISDALPHDIEWDNPKRTRLLRSLSLTVAVTLIIAGLILVVIGHIVSELADLSSLTFITWLYAAIFGLNSFSLYKKEIEHISLHGKTLQARVRGKIISMEPCDVTSAYWGAPGMLNLHTHNVQLVIPLDSVYDESSKLILAIIRWLRESDKPILVIIPETLRASSVTPLTNAVMLNATVDKAEVRLSFADRIALIILLLFFTLLCTALALQKSEVEAVATGVTLAAVISSTIIWWITGAYFIAVDRTCIVESFLFWKKEVAWEDIVGYTVGNRAGAGIQNRTLRHTLWGADSQILMTISLLCGTKADIEHFLQFMFAQLVNTLPMDELNKPWKAQPWQDT